MSRNPPPRRRTTGFTLVEVLVALFIVALGMSALLGVMGSSADTAAYLRDKTFAQWIALNHLAEVRLAANLPSQGTSDGEVDYAGRHWRWSQEVSPLNFPGMYRVDVKVQQADTAAGKDAPWMAQATGVLSDSVAPPREQSDYQEFTPAAGPAGAPGKTNVPGTTGGLGRPGSSPAPAPNPAPRQIGAP